MVVAIMAESLSYLGVPCPPKPRVNVPTFNPIILWVEVGFSVVELSLSSLLSLSLSASFDTRRCVQHVGKKKRIYGVS